MIDLYQIKHIPSNQIFAIKAKMANTFIDRLIGLMFAKKMNGFDALILEPCNSIHTCFMRYPIDVLFVSKDNTVVKIIRNLKPWRMTLLYFKSYKVIELYADKLPKNINIGDKVEICLN